MAVEGRLAREAEEGERCRGARAEFLTALGEMAVERSESELFYAGACSTSGQDLRGAASASVYAHVSESIELAVPRQGSALIVMPGQIVHLTPGSLLVVDDGVHHAELPGDFRRPHRMLWVHLRAHHTDVGDTLFDPARGALPHGLRVPTPAYVPAIGQALCTELAARGPGYARAVHGLLTYLSALLERLIGRGQAIDTRLRDIAGPSGDARAWAAVEAALAFCEANFANGISRREVAHAVGYSPGHLGYLVSKHLGRSLSEHLAGLRTAEAVRLLRQSELSVREIACSVGYADRAHFARAFTRATGMSPTTFRRRTQPQ